MFTVSLKVTWASKQCVILRICLLTFWNFTTGFNIKQHVKVQLTLIWCIFYLKNSLPWSTYTITFCIPRTWTTDHFTHECCWPLDVTAYSACFFWRRSNLTSTGKHTECFLLNMIFIFVDYSFLALPPGFLMFTLWWRDGLLFKGNKLHFTPGQVRKYCIKPLRPLPRLLHTLPIVLATHFQNTMIQQKKNINTVLCLKQVVVASRMNQPTN